MMNALLVSGKKKNFADMKAVFGESGVKILQAETGEKALLMAAEKRFDLIVSDEALIDMTGLVLTEKLISKNPFNNCALVSNLSKEDFHEASEGLGILMQLTPAPSRLEAQKLLEHLSNILSISKKM